MRSMDSPTSVVIVDYTAPYRNNLFPFARKDAQTIMSVLKDTEGTGLSNTVTDFSAGYTVIGSELDFRSCEEYIEEIAGFTNNAGVLSILSSLVIGPIALL